MYTVLNSNSGSHQQVEMSLFSGPSSSTGPKNYRKVSFPNSSNISSFSNVHGNMKSYPSNLFNQNPKPEESVVLTKGSYLFGQASKTECFDKDNIATSGIRSRSPGSRVAEIKASLLRRSNENLLHATWASSAVYEQSPHSKSRENISSPHNRSPENLSLPCNRLPENPSAAQNRSRENPSSPHNRSRENPSLPHNRSPENPSSAQNRSPENSSSPHNHSRENPSSPHNRSRENLSLPHNRSRENPSSPHNRSRENLSLPHNRSRENPSSPQNRSPENPSSAQNRSQGSLSKSLNHLLPDNLQSPHRENLSSPRNCSHENQSSPHNYSVGNLSSPQNRSHENLSSPNNHLCENISSPHNCAKDSLNKSLNLSPGNLHSPHICSWGNHRTPHICSRGNHRSPHNCSRENLSSPDNRSVGNLSSPHDRSQENLSSPNDPSHENLSKPLNHSWEDQSSPFYSQQKKLSSPHNRSEENLGSPTGRSRKILRSPLNQSVEDLASPLNLSQGNLSSERSALSPRDNLRTRCDSSDSGKSDRSYDRKERPRPSKFSDRRRGESNSHTILSNSDRTVSDKTVKDTEKSNSFQRRTRVAPSHYKRLKSQEEIEYEEYAAVLASKLRNEDCALSEVIHPPADFKSSTDYLDELFVMDYLDELFVTDIEISPVPSPTSRNKVSPAASSSRSRPGVICSPDLSLFNRQKGELITRLSRKLQILEEEQEKLQQEVRSNDRLGAKIGEIIEQKCENQSHVEKYRLLVDELDKVLRLIFMLSGRLAKAENAILCLPESADTKQKGQLVSKCEELREKLNDAKELKEGIDRRSIIVAKYLPNYLSSEELMDYQHFVKMKTKLELDLQEIKDKIVTSKDQLMALQKNIKFSSS